MQILAKVERNTEQEVRDYIAKDLDEALAGIGITGRKAEKAGKKLKKWLAFLERECYTVKRTFVNAFFFCAQKTGFFHHEQAQKCVLAKKEKGGFT